MTDGTSGCHQFLDEDINNRIGTDMGFTALVGAQPLRLDDAEFQGLRDRYGTIKLFQETCRDLLRQSLAGEAAPEIAHSVLGELPAHLGHEYHRALDPAQTNTPVFFRTDESRSGRLTEIQCCGSGWGIVTQLERLYAAYPALFGSRRRFDVPLPEAFARDLEGYVGSPPIVHHLVDNASRPHGVRYFIQHTRDAGVRYLHHDKGVMPTDCNFVRAHDFISLPTHNFFADRMGRCARGSLFFDLPPSSLYDGKIILAWPFWEKTRHAFSDEVRALFPHTAVIEEGGIELEGGERVTLDEFARIPNQQRTWYLKYAGTDIAINWGSRAVYLASTLSRVKCREMLDSILADRARGRYWVAQRADRELESMEILGRDGDRTQVEAYGKISGFYGPDGLIGIFGMHRRHHKVHGSADTVITIGY